MLVFLRFGGGLFHFFQEIQKAVFFLNLSFQRNQIREEANQLLAFRLLPPGHRAAGYDVFLAGVAPKQCLEASQQHNVRRTTFTEGEILYYAAQLLA